MEDAKNLVRDLVKKGGGYKAAAGWLRLSVTRLHDLGNPRKDDDPRNQKLSFWLDLEEFSGSDGFRDALAKDAGFVLMPTDIGPHADMQTVLTRIVDTINTARKEPQ